MRRGRGREGKGRSNHRSRDRTKSRARARSRNRKRGNLYKMTFNIIKEKRKKKLTGRGCATFLCLDVAEGGNA